jgi:putative toxin-antitoxin system antitoxin component (TIGR02293 family)
MAKTYKSTRKAPSTKVAQFATLYGTGGLSVPALLGISQKLSNEMDFIRLSRAGIKKNAVVSVAKHLGITLEKMSAILHISSRTFQRMKESEPLDIYTSEQTIEMARVLERACRVFESEQEARSWLNAPLKAIGGIAPTDILDTSFGAQIITDILGRIEQGVYS